MGLQSFIGILIPFLGTSLGAACVFFMKNALRDHTQRFLTGFAAGVMTAASIWSLLIPAIEESDGYGAFAFFPATVGFWVGILFLLLLDHVTPHLHQFADAPGIAIQNFPEGAIISMPLYSRGVSRGKSFAGGVLSGAVEPAGAALMVLLASWFIPAMPYLLSFAAGAMLYVVVEELIPEMSHGSHSNIGHGSHSNIGVLSFALGFSLMMILDVALG